MRIESTKKNARYRGTKESFKTMTNEQENFYDVKLIKFEQEEIKEKIRKFEYYINVGVEKEEEVDYEENINKEIKLKPNQKYINIETDIVGLEVKDILIKDENHNLIDRENFHVKDFIIEIINEEPFREKVFISYRIRYKNFKGIGKEEIIKQKNKIKQEISSLKERCLLYELSYI